MAERTRRTTTGNGLGMKDAHFFLFLKEYRQDLKKQKRTASAYVSSREAKKVWLTMSEESKMPYVNRVKRKRNLNKNLISKLTEKKSTKGKKTPMKTKSKISKVKTSTPKDKYSVGPFTSSKPKLTPGDRSLWAAMGCGEVKYSPSIENRGHVLNGVYKSPKRETSYMQGSSPKRSPMKSSSVKTLSPKRTPVDSPKRTTVHSPKRTLVHSPKRTPVHSPKRTPVNSPKGTPVSSPKKTPVNSPSKTPVNSPKRTPVPSLKATLMPTPKQSPVHIPRHSLEKLARSSPAHSPARSFANSPKQTLSITPAQSPVRSQSLSNIRSSPMTGGRSPLRNPSKKNRFSHGQDVLARWTDGLFYLGNILKVEEKKEKCYVQFEDNSKYWILFKDLQKGAKEGEVMCCMCQMDHSETPNEIVLCDNCGLGYHQQCHYPPIPSEDLDPDIDWSCRLCVFAATVKAGGALKKGPNAQALQVMKQSLPYDLDALTWDAYHKVNVEQCYCYCGGPGEWYLKMLQCCRCRQWFHEACMQCLEHPLLYGDRFYLFACSHCNSGPEYIKRLEMKWADVYQLVLFNLNVINQSRKFSDYQEVMVPWMEENWATLQVPHLTQPSTEEEWDKQIEVLRNHKTRFMWGREVRQKGTWWGLRMRVPPPAPTVILPVDGPINDDTMSDLKMKGKRTKSFVPIQCHSPVLYQKLKPGLSIDESISFKSKKSKKIMLGIVPKEGRKKKAFKTTKQDSSASKVPLEKDTSKTPRKKKKKKSLRTKNTLERFIPYPPTFDGHYHPFKTDLEQNLECAKHKLKAEILNLYHNSLPVCIVPDTPPSSVCSSAGTPTPSESSTSILTSLSVQPTPTLSQTLGKRGKRRKAEEALEEAPPAKRSKRQAISKSRLQGQYDPLNIIDPATITAVGSQQINFKQLKSNVGSYFGAADRLAKGEKFQVVAQRVTTDGKVQYLVEWEGMVR